MEFKLEFLLTIVVCCMSSGLSVWWMMHLAQFTKSVRASCVSHYLWDVCTYVYKNETLQNWFILRDYMKSETYLRLIPDNPQNSCDLPAIVSYWILAVCIILASIVVVVYHLVEMHGRQKKNAENEVA